MNSSLRTFVSLLLLPLALLAGCASVMDFMPQEIREAEESSIAGAKRLVAAHPEALRSYRVNDRTVHYIALEQQVPPRPLVIFIHGSPGLWRSWIRYLSDTELQSRANMIAMDRPGFGTSDSGRIERGFRAQIAALEPLLRNVQSQQQVILVGHAYGAALAARVAMGFPDTVTDLILIAAPLDPTLQNESWFQYLADWPPLTWLLPAEIVVFNREYLGLERELTDMLPLWPKVSQRVSLLFGEQDEEVPIATAEFARQVLANAHALNVIRIPNMNHFIPWTKSDLVKVQILDHLNSPHR